MQRAEEWQNQQREALNYSLGIQDPPLNLPKYFRSYCESNSNGYVGFKTNGIKYITQMELDRYEKKKEFQEVAFKRRIPREDLLEFKK